MNFSGHLQNIILVIGAQRSGTTWLAKIFDSHPLVRYCHEPDTVLRFAALPVCVTKDDIPRYRQSTQDYLKELIAIRTLKTAGSLPVFRKTEDTFARFAGRTLFCYALRGVERIPGAAAVRQLKLPDRLTPAMRDDSKVVLKSVSSWGRIGLFADALPQSRCIFILRDPRGQVASVMRGRALSKFEAPLPIREMLEVEQASRHGVTADRLRGMSEIEQLTWYWVIQNEKTIEDLRGLPNSVIVRYQDLVAHPVQRARALFAFAGLDWHAQTADFIDRSTHYAGPERYYQVFKNTALVANRWRRELTAEDQRRIAAIASMSSLSKFFPELQDAAAGRVPRPAARVAISSSGKAAYTASIPEVAAE